MSSKNAPDTKRDRPRRTWWLAARLTALYAGVSGICILIATVFLYWALHDNLEKEDRDALREQVHLIRTFLGKRTQDSRAFEQGVEWESSTRRYGRISLRILDGGGSTLGETPDIDGALHPRVFPPPSSTESAVPAIIRAPNGRTFMAITADVPAPAIGGDARIVQVALDTTEEQELLAAFRRRAIPMIGIVLLACALLGHGIARATLRRVDVSFDRLERFSSEIAHELRTPLNNLRGEMEVALTKDRSPDEYRELIGSSLEESARLGRLIESFLFLARAESPATRINREQTDVRRELEAVRDFYEPAAAEAGVELTVDAPAGLEASFDRLLFQRALANLVENALSSTPVGGKITLRALQRPAAVRIEVVDTGSGIPVEELPFVFDHFHRDDRKRSGARSGTGLGLAIVKRIAELHGGAAEIRSALARGTSVTLTVPLVRSDMRSPKLSESPHGRTTRRKSS